MAYSKEVIDLSLYRLEKAKKDLEDAKKTLELEMYDTSANRSYYAIFMPLELYWHLMVKISKSIQELSVNFNKTI